MPLTLAHPAAVVPLRDALGRFGHLPALVVGSIAPDLAYFLPLGVERTWSHSPAGLLLFCLPLGLAVVVAFHGLLGPLLAGIAPGPVRARLPEDAFRPAWPRHGPAVVACLGIGASTHVAWDAFCHPGGVVHGLAPWLATPIWTVGGYPVLGLKLLQHGSTAVGMLLLAWWLGRWIARTAPMERDRPAAEPAALRATCWALLLVPPALAGIAIAAASFDPARGPVVAVQLALGRAIPVAGGLLFAGAVVAGALWQLAAARRPA